MSGKTSAENRHWKGKWENLKPRPEMTAARDAEKNKSVACLHAAVLSKLQGKLPEVCIMIHLYRFFNVYATAKLETYEFCIILEKLLFLCCFIDVS